MLEKIIKKLEKDLKKLNELYFSYMNLSEKKDYLNYLLYEISFYKNNINGDYDEEVD